MKIAYLVNHYPAVSHSFIRREIAALEARGLEVLRYSIRSAASDFPDPRDHQERERTQFILAQGALSLCYAMIWAAMTRPMAMLSAMRCAISMARKSDAGLIRHAAYLAEAAWLLRTFKTQHVSHLHAHFGTNPAAVARLCRRLGGPQYSFTVHGPDELDAPRSYDLGGKGADAAAVIAISNFGKSQLMRWIAYPHWPKLHVVHCGLDQDFLAAEPVSIAATPKLCTVARLSGQKGLPLLIEACGMLASKGTDFELSIIGDGEMRSELKTLAKKHGVDDRVHFLGACSSDRVKAEIQAARAFVLPSFAEGLPVVLMEALALARPVVTTFVAGIPELVDAQCGWLIPAGSTQALYVAMEDVLKTPIDRLNAMGAEGRQRVLARHNIADSAAELAAIFGQSEVTQR